MWQLLLLLGAGLGIYELSKDDKIEDAKKEKEDDVNWREEVQSSINNDGVEYTFIEKDDWSSVKNQSFQNAVKNYKNKHKNLKQAIAKLPKKQKDYVNGVIDKEGMDYAFDGYSDFKEYYDETIGDYKPITNENFQESRKEYIQAYKRMLKF